MGIYREWPRPDMDNESPIGYITDNREADRAHYAEVEAEHTAEVARLNDIVTANQELAGDRYMEVKAMKAELAEAKDSAKFWEDRFDVCAGQLKKAEAERDESRAAYKSLVVTHVNKGARLTRERDEAREDYNRVFAQLNTAILERDEARAEVAEAQAAHNTAVFELHHTRRERDKAREALKSRCADGCEKTLSNLYRAGIERDEARAEVVNLKTLLKLTQEQLIRRNNELLDKAMLDLLPSQFKRPTGRIEAIEARVSNLEAQSNAKQADEALDSLKVAR